MIFLIACHIPTVCANSRQDETFASVDRPKKSWTKITFYTAVPTHKFVYA